jgi:hypothetical protein
MIQRTLAWVGLIFLAGIFLTVFVSVLQMRITKGDAYPHYASYRTDPLGTSGLYEALSRIPGVSAQRNVQSLMKIDSLDADSSLFLIGVTATAFKRIRVPDQSPVLEAIEKKGARLILTLNPERVPDVHLNTLSENEEEWLEKRRKKREEERRKLEKAKNKSSEPDTPKPTAKEEEMKKAGPHSKKKDDKKDSTTEIELDKIREIGPRMTDRLGIDLADVKKYERPGDGWEATPGNSIQDGGMAKNLPEWKSQYRFEIPETHRDVWKVAARVDGEPVVVERKLGQGSVVLTTDSYFASNEALFNGGDSEFLTWLIAGKSRLFFDETMHGSEETVGTMTIVRQYRLHGFVLGILVFVVLWAWKSASSLVPGSEAIERGLIGTSGTVSGEDAKSGFISLLQRSIPGRELIPNCLATWKSSHIREITPQIEQEISAITGQHLHDPKANPTIDTYLKIAGLLRKK